MAKHRFIKKAPDKAPQSAGLAKPARPAATKTMPRARSERVKTRYG